jgi:hypothetical protein
MAATAIQCYKQQMDRVENPYTPGAGSTPEALTGRDEELEAFTALLARLERGRTEPAPLILGLRGVGKTVLLTEYEDIAAEHGWLVGKEEASPDTALPRLLAPWLRECFAELRPAKALKQRLQQRFARLQSFSVSVTPAGEFTFGFDLNRDTTQDELSSDLTSIFLDLGEAAQARGQGCVFLLDEVQFVKPDEFAPLVTALHRVNQKRLPVAFVGAGLPQLPRLVGEAKSYTERYFDFTNIDKLPVDAARDAVVLPARARGVEWEEGALDALLKVSGGYPFFLQQYAKFAWLEAEQSPISARAVLAGQARATRKLDDGFFETRIQRVTDRERRYLLGMARLPGDGPYQSSSVAGSAGGTTQKFSDVRDTLIRKGLIYSPGPGTLDFTVPHFAAFMVRRFGARNPLGPPAGRPTKRPHQ